eukprot:358496-Chlamydomonas_euryale.AAC.2
MPVRTASERATPLLRPSGRGMPPTLCAVAAACYQPFSRINARALCASRRTRVRAAAHGQRACLVSACADLLSRGPAPDRRRGFLASPPPFPSARPPRTCHPVCNAARWWCARGGAPVALQNRRWQCRAIVPEMRR